MHACGRRSSHGATRMSDLRVAGDSLRQAAAHIREVVESFASAGSDAHEAASFVGHGGLASRVTEFADGWDIHRGKFSDELRDMADMLEAVDDTFTDLDNRTAQTLIQATPTAPVDQSPLGHAPGIAPAGALSGGGHR